MSKKSHVAWHLKQLALAACSLCLVFHNAAAQLFDQPVDPAPTMTAPTMPATVAPDTEADRGLPAIANTAAERSAQQKSQSAERLNASRNARNELQALDGIPAKSVFATYVQTATGASLELFGKNLFNRVPSTFAPVEGAQVNGDYVIGSGDEIQIRGWGMVTIDVTATVDRNGAIYIPRVGAVKVAGLKYRDLQGQLKQAISKNYSNFELTASIAQTRALQIYVVGNAVRPGTYTLNSMSTLLNALFTSGGPNANGSMRRIELKRSGATVTTFDLYDMLVKGDKSRDATLRDGDVIYIPEVGPLVALTGNVKSPAIYELNGAASVADLVSWAGGLESAADQKQIIVEKSVDNAYQRLATVVAERGAMANVLSALPVQGADVIRVFVPGAVAVQARLQSEFVRVSGEVKKGGVFQINKGETLRDFMFRIGGTTDFAYLYATQVRRESVRRVQQMRLDEIAARFERDVDAAATQRVSGSTDRDAIAVQAAEAERQRRVAEKLRSVKAEGRIVLELADGNAELKNLPELTLQDGDTIYVPRKPDTIDVLGSVFQASSFIYKPQRTVKDYLQLAGGGTGSADLSEMYVIRADGTARSGSSGGWFSSVSGLKVNPGDTVVVPEKIDRSNLRQSIKEWTAIFYQFGLGAAGLKVLQN